MVTSAASLFPASYHKISHADDKLGLLALIYREISRSIPTESLQKLSEPEIVSAQEQVNALQNLLPASKFDLSDDL